MSVATVAQCDKSPPGLGTELFILFALVWSWWGPVGPGWAQLGVVLSCGSASVQPMCLVLLASGERVLVAVAVVQEP